MLLAAGHRAAAVGNIGRPILEAMADDVTYDVYALELSSFQLHWTHSLALHSAAILNLEQDHLEWYEDSADWSEHPDPMDAYGAVSYTHLRAHETVLDLVCRLLLEKN